jgi:hypothetical protein
LKAVQERQVTIDENVLESVEYLRWDTWRELKQESVLISDRMYMKIIFAKKAEVNIQGKVYLWHTTPLYIPEKVDIKKLVKALFKLEKEEQKKNLKELLKQYETKDKSQANYKYSSDVAMTEKKKSLSFGLILRFDQSLTSVCSEYKRKETDPNYAMRMKNFLMLFLIFLIVLLLMKDSGLLTMDILEMKFWWIYTIPFAIIYAMHREAIEAKCWYMASLRLSAYREPIDLEKKDFATRAAQFLPFWEKPRYLHLDIETHIVLPYYSSEISPQSIIGIDLEKLENDVFSVAMNLVSDNIAEKTNYEKRYEVAKEENSVLRAEIAKMKQQSRLAIEMGKSMAAEQFEIVVTNEDSRAGLEGTGRRIVTNIDFTKIILVVIFGIIGIGVLYLLMTFFIYIDLDFMSKVMIALGFLFAVGVVALLIYKGRT